MVCLDFRSACLPACLPACHLSSSQHHNHSQFSMYIHLFMRFKSVGICDIKLPTTNNLHMLASAFTRTHTYTHTRTNTSHQQSACPHSRPIRPIAHNRLVCPAMPCQKRASPVIRLIFSQTSAMCCYLMPCNHNATHPSPCPQRAKLLPPVRRHWRAAAGGPTHRELKKIR